MGALVYKKTVKKGDKCLQVPSLPANFGVKKLLSGEPASPLVNDTMSVASGYSTVTGAVFGPSVIARYSCVFSHVIASFISNHLSILPPLILDKVYKLDRKRSP